MRNSRAEQKTLPCLWLFNKEQALEMVCVVPGLGLKVCGAGAPNVVSHCGWISEDSFIHPQWLSGNRTIIVQSQLTVVYQE